MVDLEWCMIARFTATQRCDLSLWAMQWCVVERTHGVMYVCASDCGMLMVFTLGGVGEWLIVITTQRHGSFSFANATSHKTTKQHIPVYVCVGVLFFNMVVISWHCMLPLLFFFLFLLAQADWFGMFSLVTADRVHWEHFVSYCSILFCTSVAWSVRRIPGSRAFFFFT